MKKHSAFSLIELSIVILVIGILIVGITHSTRMVKEAKLRSARTITQSSPVTGISNLMLWYETSLETSFDTSAQTDGAAISTWYDNNKQSASKNNATLTLSGYTTCASSPDFKENVFNGGIPAIRFNGTSDCLNFNGTSLVGTSYTVFVVEQKRATVTNNKYFFGGTNGTSDANLHLGYALDTALRFSQYTVNLGYTNSILTYSTPTPRIHTAIQNVSTQRSYWLNGGTTAESSNTGSTYTVALSSYSNSALGRYGIASTSFYSYFNGDLAEIIMYTRALSTEERQAVENYLSRKYAITLS